MRPIPMASETPPASAWSPLPGNEGGDCVSDSPRTSPLPVSVVPDPLSLSCALVPPSRPEAAAVSSASEDGGAATPVPVNDADDVELPHAPARDRERASRIPRRSRRRTRCTRRSSMRATPRRECGSADPTPARRISTRRWSVEMLSRQGSSRVTVRRRCRSERLRSGGDVRAAERARVERALPEALEAPEPRAALDEGADDDGDDDDDDDDDPPPPDTDGADGVDGADGTAGTAGAEGGSGSGGGFGTGTGGGGGTGRGTCGGGGNCGSGTAGGGGSWGSCARVVIGTSRTAMTATSSATR